VQQVESELNPAFHEMLWWQWDLVHRAFGIVSETGSSSQSANSESGEESSGAGTRQKA
jgi:hypothetical protein